jgi:hypothetical protein
MKIKHHPLDETILNKRVWNAKKTYKGTIVEYSHKNLKDVEDFLIDIKWDHGGFSPCVPMVEVELEFAEEVD